MYKYYDAILNRAGDALAGYLMRLSDNSGAPIPIYADENETPIITESGIENAAKSDENGMVRFYVYSGEYNISIYDENGVYQQGEVGVPMIGDLREQLDEATGLLEESQAAAAAAESASGAASNAKDAAELAEIAAEAAQTSAEAAQAQAEIAASTATNAALAQDIYPIAARTYVPRGATGNGAITGGSGGTNGTFDLAFTGGNFSVNPTGTFTVSGGAVTAISLTGPGLYIGTSPTAPTLSFAASSGLTGASASLAVGYLVGGGRYYYTPSLDTGYFSQFQNVGNVATLVQEHFDPLSVGAAAAYAAEAEAAAVRTDAIRVDLAHVEVIGAATVSDKSSSTGAGTVTAGMAITKAGKGLSVEYYGKGTGTAYIQIVSRVASTSTNTIESEAAISVTPGLHTVELPDLEFEVGDRVGFRSAGGLIAQQAGAGAGFGGVWISASQITAGNSYVDASRSNVDYAIRFELYSETVTGPRFDDVNIRVGGDDAQNSYHFLPPFAGDPGIGSAISGNTFVSALEPTDYDRILTRIHGRIRTAGDLALRNYAVAGTAMTRVGADVIATFPSTGYVDTDTDPIELPYFILRAGETVGQKAVTASLYDFIADGNFPTPYFSTAASGASFTAGTVNNINMLGLGLEFAPLSLSKRVADLEGNSAAAFHPTTAFHVIWMLGESHVAGRATSFESAVPVGRGYCYRRATTSIGHLVDPTGNDSTAVSGSGRGSWGPPLGQEMLDASHGAVGAMVINSGFGGSVIGTNWGSSGNAWTQAKTDWDTAIAAIKTAKIPIAGVTIVIGIGSNDAAAATAKATFKTGLNDLITRAKAYANAGDVPVAIVQTGPWIDSGSNAGVPVIQQAQAEIVRETAGVYMATSAPKFAIDYGWMQDDPHFNQTGNDAIGPAIAEVALARGAGCYPAGLE